MLAHTFPELGLTLLDGSERRASWLVEAVKACGLGARVSVVAARAEVAGHDERFRGRFPAVVARSFGSPPVTAECAAGLLAPAGVLVVSEPPRGAAGRWPEGPLAELGLRPERQFTLTSGHFQVLRLVDPCPDRYPRRTGVPGKRPLYRVGD